MSKGGFSKAKSAFAIWEKEENRKASRIKVIDKYHKESLCQVTFTKFNTCYIYLQKLKQEKQLWIPNLITLVRILAAPVIFRSDFKDTNLSIPQAWSLFFSAGQEENVFSGNRQLGWFFNNLLIVTVATGIVLALW